MRKTAYTGMILIFCATVLFTCIGYFWIVRKEANAQNIAYGSKELYIKNVSVEDDSVEITQFISTMLTLNVAESARDVVITVTMQKATTYHAICGPTGRLLRNTKLRWIGKLMASPMTMAIM